MVTPWYEVTKCQGYAHDFYLPNIVAVPHSPVLMSKGISSSYPKPTPGGFKGEVNLRRRPTIAGHNQVNQRNNHKRGNRGDNWTRKT